jgi:hypothetical protein
MLLVLGEGLSLLGVKPTAFGCSCRDGHDGHNHNRTDQPKRESQYAAEKHRHSTGTSTAGQDFLTRNAKGFERDLSASAKAKPLTYSFEVERQ